MELPCLHESRAIVACLQIQKCCSNLTSFCDGWILFCFIHMPYIFFLTTDATFINAFPLASKSPTPFACPCKLYDDLIRIHKAAHKLPWLSKKKNPSRHLSSQNLFTMRYLSSFILLKSSTIYYICFEVYYYWQSGCLFSVLINSAWSTQLMNCWWLAHN